MIVNGFKIIAKTVLFKGKRRVYIAECKLCKKHYDTCLAYLTKANSCGCSWKTPGVPRRLQHSYAQMKTRCENNNHPSYKKYGAIGINICDEWQNSKNFYKWALSNRYKDNLTLDRIDNTKGYFPENCRWATDAEQQRNRKCARFSEQDIRYIRSNPNKLTQKQIAKKFNVNAGAICRIQNYTRFKDIL